MDAQIPMNPMTRLPSGEVELIEEALCDSYECLESGVGLASEIESILDKKVESGVFKQLLERRLASIREGQLILSEEAENTAKKIIRRKRLAERLLKDVLSVSEENVHAAACQWEHTLSKDVTNSICTLLGHPTHSPMERPIPPGECCKAATKTAAPVICSLDQMKPGRRAKIVYLLVTRYPELNRLLSMGLTPGCEIELIQIFPTIVVQVNESQLAFDESVAEGIFVHPL